MSERRNAPTVATAAGALLAMAAGAAIVAPAVGEVVQGVGDTPTTGAPPGILVIDAGPADPMYVLTVADCEDYAGQSPCVTWDVDGFRLVRSYAPYRFTGLGECDAEDFPTNLPCVWRNREASTGGWLVYVSRFDVE